MLRLYIIFVAIFQFCGSASSSEENLIRNLVVKNIDDVERVSKAAMVSFDANEDDLESILRLFCSSKSLGRIKVLDLSDMGINDKHIKILSENASLKRLIRLDLSNKKIKDVNQGVTTESLRFVLQSPYIGSVRDLPQLCGTLGIPSTVIDIDCRKTSITRSALEAAIRKKDEIDNISHIAQLTYNLSPEERKKILDIMNIDLEGSLFVHHPFRIEYKHPRLGYQTSYDAENGIKYLEVRCGHDDDDQTVTVGFPRQ